MCNAKFSWVLYSGSMLSREVEAIGTKEALQWITTTLQWITTRRTDRCIMETDSLVLVAACNGGPREVAIGSVVGDCLRLLKRIHPSPMLVKFVYRIW